MYIRLFEVFLSMKAYTWSYQGQFLLIVFFSLSISYTFLFLYISHTFEVKIGHFK